MTPVLETQLKVFLIVVRQKKRNFQNTDIKLDKIGIIWKGIFEICDHLT